MTRLYWHEQMGMWFATRYQDVDALARDKRFSSARVDAFIPPDGDDEKTRAVRRFFTDWMAFNDPPEHTRLRKLVARAFVPRTIATLESFIHQAVDEALDGVRGTRRRTSPSPADERSRRRKTYSSAAGWLPARVPRRRAGPDGGADRHDSAAGQISPDRASGQRTEPAQ
jgi:hypothetical protein